MTTTVSVSAHCDKETTEVKVITRSPGATDETTTLQDGESTDVYAYDDRVITVKEVKK